MTVTEIYSKGGVTGLRILLIEDDDPFTRLMRIYLKNHYVISAGRLKQALAELSKEPFDVIILDPGLPDAATGLDAYQQIRDVAPETPMIALSGSVDVNLAHALIQEGAMLIRKDVLIAANPDQRLEALLDSTRLLFGGMEKFKQAIRNVAPDDKT